MALYFYTPHKYLDHLLLLNQQPPVCHIKVYTCSLLYLTCIDNTALLTECQCMSLEQPLVAKKTATFCNATSASDILLYGCYAAAYPLNIMPKQCQYRMQHHPSIVKAVQLTVSDGSCLISLHFFYQPTLILTLLTHAMFLILTI
jgi:hypothetical protein